MLKIARVKELKRLASSRDPNVKLSVIVWKAVNHCAGSHENCLRFDDGSGGIFKKEGRYRREELENAPHGTRGGPTENRISEDEWAALQHSFVIEK